MVENEEHTFARQSSATFLKEAGVGILWLPLSEHVQLDIPTRTSWDEASPHLERCIVEHVHALYRVQVATTGGQGHSGRRTKRVLASLTNGSFITLGNGTWLGLAIAEADAPSNSFS